MTTRKKTNRSVRKTSRGHQKSLSGKILPPLDVRSTDDLANFKKRIMKGPITIVMVYADWCSHCHEMRPHFDAAAKSVNRSMQAVSVNETMLDKVNQTINESINKNAKSIEVEGYPSILLVDNQGNKVSDINPVRDTAVMTKVMTEPVTPPEEPEVESLPVKNAGSATGTDGSAKGTDGSATDTFGSANQLMNSYVGEDKLLGSIASSIKPNRASNLKNNTDAIAPVLPSNSNRDLTGVKQNKGIVGGSLFGAISQSAYTLAPAAVLLATAATIMSRKRTRKSHKKGKKKSATRRRM